MTTGMVVPNTAVFVSTETLFVASSAPPSARAMFTSTPRALTCTMIDAVAVAPLVIRPNWQVTISLVCAYVPPDEVAETKSTDAGSTSASIAFVTAAAARSMSTAACYA